MIDQFLILSPQSTALRLINDDLCILIEHIIWYIINEYNNMSE